MSTATINAPTPVADSSDRPAWLAKRRGGVTATDIAKVGANGGGPATLRSILKDKRGEAKEWAGNASTRHGSAREPEIAKWVESQSRRGVFGSGALIPSQGLFAHPENERHLATPDGRSEDWEFFRELVEIKTTVDDWKTIPRSYLRQVWWQQYVLGADRTLVVWEQRDENFQPMDLEPRWQWVKRDQAEIDILVAHAGNLLLLMDDEMPAPDPVADSIITRYLAQKAVVDEAKAALDVLEKEARAWIGDRSNAKVLGTAGDLSYSTSTSNRLATTELKNDHPDLYESYTRTSSTSRLVIAPIKTESSE